MFPFSPLLEGKVVAFMDNMARSWRDPPKDFVAQRTQEVKERFSF